MSSPACTKVTYTSLSVAKAAARRLRDKGDIFRAYKCDRCRGWHVTTKKRSARQVRRSKRPGRLRGRQIQPGETLEGLCRKMRGGSGE